MLAFVPRGRLARRASRRTRRQLLVVLAFLLVQVLPHGRRAAVEPRRLRHTRRTVATRALARLRRPRAVVGQPDRHDACADTHIHTARASDRERERLCWSVLRQPRPTEAQQLEVDAPTRPTSVAPKPAMSCLSLRMSLGTQVSCVMASRSFALFPGSERPTAFQHGFTLLWK
jgi:hypothetical protein